MPGRHCRSWKPRETTQASPGLFDLTTLQREANGRFGFSAKNTLGLAQALYEKHKVLTYPRTDARALPEDYIETVKSTLDRRPDDLRDKRLLTFDGDKLSRVELKGIIDERGPKSLA